MKRSNVLFSAICGTVCLAGGATISAQDSQPFFFVDSGQSLGSSISRAVALDDLDGDGDVDAFVANRGGADKVWLNDGNSVFADSGQSLGSGDSADVALGDVDGDFDIDAFVCESSGTNRVWLNDGSGGFTDSGQSLGNNDSRSVSLADVDGDGDLDAFVTHIIVPNSDHKITVWTNNGAGSFSPVEEGAGSFGLNPRAAVGDLDGDNDVDAYVVLGYGNPDEVLLNDGEGDFELGGPTPGNSDQDVALGDLDGDGDMDAFIVVRGLTGWEPSRVYLNDGSAAFVDSGQSLGSAPNNAVALGDLEGDGDIDAFVASRAGDSVWLNDGDAVFSSNGQTLGDSWSYDVALSDLDGDGDLDAFVVSDPASMVWLNVPEYVFSDGFESGDVSAWIP